MDEFAQTRGDDDLFDDEVVPIISQPEPVPEPEPEPEIYTPTLQAEEAQAQGAVHPQLIQDQREDQPPVVQHRRRGNGRGRGRGNGFSKKARPVKSPAQPEKVEGEGDVSGGNQTQQPDNEDVPNENGDGNGEDASEETKVKETVTPKVPAVRGDRSKTGGVRKPKLTEEELSERMAAAKINAAKRAAAHARAEADEASFQEREKVAVAKRKEERQNRRVMMGEREKNRQRKLKGQTGREWDVEKTPESISAQGRGGGSSYRRGAHGAVVNDRPGMDASIYAVEQDEDEMPNFQRNSDFRGRGRGVRGGARGGRGGRGRGGRGGTNNRPNDFQDNNTLNQQKYPSPSGPPAIEAENEFPALPCGSGTGNVSIPKPSSPKQETSSTTPISTQDLSPRSKENDQDDNDDLPSPFVSSGTWADQVESSEVIRKAKEDAFQPNSESAASTTK